MLIAAHLNISSSYPSMIIAIHVIIPSSTTNAHVLIIWLTFQLDLPCEYLMFSLVCIRTNFVCNNQLFSSMASFDRNLLTGCTLSSTSTPHYTTVSPIASRSRKQTRLNNGWLTVKLAGQQQRGKELGAWTYWRIGDTAATAITT